MRCPWIDFEKTRRIIPHLTRWKFDDGENGIQNRTTLFICVVIFLNGGVSSDIELGLGESEVNCPSWLVNMLVRPLVCQS